MEGQGNLHLWRKTIKSLRNAPPLRQQASSPKIKEKNKWKHCNNVLFLSRMNVWDDKKTLRGRFTRIQISLRMILNFYPDLREQRNYTKTVLTRTCPKLVCCQQIVKESSWESGELCFCYLLDLSHSLRTSSPLQGDWVTRDQPDHLLSPSTSSTTKNIVPKLDFRLSTQICQFCALFCQGPRSNKFFYLETRILPN